MTTSVYKLNWPGLEDVPVVVIDPVTSDVYTASSPLPIYKRMLDIAQNRYVRMTDVLKFFATEQKEETEMIISSLQKNFCIQKSVDLKIPVDSSDNQVTNNNENCSSTYLPVYLLLALFTVWPCCAAFQKARDKLVESLDIHSEIICRHCGFVNPDCTCKHTGKESLVSCIGYAISVSEKATQVDIQSPSKQQSNNVLVASSVITSGSTSSTPSSNNMKLIAVPAFPLASCGQQLTSLPMSVLPLSFSLPEPYVSQCTFLTLPSPKSNVSVCSMSNALLNSNNNTPIIAMSPSTMQPATLQQQTLPCVSRVDTNSSTKSLTSPNTSQISLLKSNDTTNQSSVSVNFFRPPKQTNSLSTQSKPLEQSDKQNDANGQNSRSVYKISMHGFVASNNTSKKLECSEEESNNSTTADEVAHANKKSKQGDSPDSKSSDKNESTRKSCSHKANHFAGESKIEHQNNADVEDEYSSVVCRKNSKQNSVESLDDKDLASKKATKLWKQLDSNSDDDNDYLDFKLSLKSSSKQLENAWDVMNDILHHPNSPQINAFNCNKNDPSYNQNSVKNDSQLSDIAKLFDDKDTCNTSSEKKMSERMETEDQIKTNNVRTDIEGENNTDRNVSISNLPSNHVSDKSNASDNVSEIMQNNKSASFNGLDSEKRDEDKSSSSKIVDTIKTSVVAKPCRLYGKFEYLPTGEHIYRCTIAKCSQCFEGKQAALLHSRSHHPRDESSTNLRCPECEEMSVPFFQWFDLLRHLRSKHDVMISRLANTCSYCGLTFESEDQQISHMDYHYSNRYKCIHCGLLLLTWNQVKRHIEICPDRNKNATNLGCPYCTFVFHKKTIRNLHLLSHSDSGLTCAVCEDNVVWPDWKGLRKHYQQKHAKIMQAKIGPFHSTLPIKRKPPACCVCGVQYKTYDQFNAHMIRMHVYVPYVLVECAQCLRQFRSEKSHDWHVRHAHGEEVPCDKCSFVGTTKASLKAHVAEHHQAKQHACTECDKSFNLYSQLRVHMAHHARRTIHSCQYCEQEFKHQSDLRQHVQTEHASSVEVSKKEVHGCPECDYTCKSRLTLKVHVSTHHPELLESSLVLNTPSLDDDISDSDRNHGNLDDDDDEETDDAFEDEEGEHLYYRTASLTSTQALYSAGYSNSATNQSVSAKRERKRKFKGDEWVETGWMDNDVDERRERKRLKRLERELEDNIRRLQKTSCARTRPHNEKRKRRSTVGEESGILKYAEWQQRLPSTQSILPGLDEDVDVSVAIPEDPKPVAMYPEVWTRYPIREHDYCKMVPYEPPAPVQRDRCTLKEEKRNDESFIRTPGVSAFQECQTVLGQGSIRLHPSAEVNQVIESVPRQQRFSSVFESVLSVQNSSQAGNIHCVSLVNTDSDSRQKHAFRGTSRVNKSLSPHKLTQSELSSFDSTLQDIDMDMASEAELLKPGSEYNILQDILGNGVDSHASPVSGAMRDSLHFLSRGSAVDRNIERSKSAAASNTFNDRYGTSPGRVYRTKNERSLSGAGYSNAMTSMIASNSLLDSLPVALTTEGDLSQPTDLDDIELCEDDYNLWQGIRDNRDVKISALGSQYNTVNHSQGVVDKPGFSFVPGSIGRQTSDIHQTTAGRFSDRMNSVVDTDTCGLDLLSSVTATFGHDRVVNRSGENSSTHIMSSCSNKIVNQNGTR